LPLPPEGQAVLQGRIDGQHNAVIEKVRNGEFPAPAAANVPAKNGELAGLSVELVNAKEWLAGKQGHLQVTVREKQNGPGMAGAKVSAWMEGRAESSACSAQTGSDGTARLDWELPLNAVPGAAVILEAAHGNAKGQLKFYLRTKTKQPA